MAHHEHRYYQLGPSVVISGPRYKLSDLPHYIGTDVNFVNSNLTPREYFVKTCASAWLWDEVQPAHRKDVAVSLIGAIKPIENMRVGQYALEKITSVHRLEELTPEDRGDIEQALHAFRADSSLSGSFPASLK